MRLLPDQAIFDDPERVADEQHAPTVHGFVTRAVRFAPQHVQPGRVEPTEQPPLGHWPTRRAAPIRRLVEPIDRHGVVGGRAFEPAPPVVASLRVDVAARIHDQRCAARRGLDMQQVVVAVPAVAKRTAVEQQIALVTKGRGIGAPAAALEEIAAMLEADVALGRRRTRHPAAGDVAKIFAFEELPRPFE